MADVNIAILGLGKIGASIGLALKRYNTNSKDHHFTITGYDSTADTSKAAKQMGAIDDIAQRPEIAVKNKDIVIVALPYGEVKNAYDFMAQDLRQGVVILDVSVLCQTSMEWAKKFLPKDAHLVCAKPIVNSKYLFNGVDKTDEAVADLFDNGTILLMPSVTCIPEAISLATDLAKILGAFPHFLDPAEHDGLVTATEVLPDFMGVVYFYMLSQSPGWGDMQRVGNSNFGMFSHALFDTHPDDLRDEILNSGDNLVRYVDQMIAQLRNFRSVIASKDDAALEAALGEASKDYEQWINRRHNNKWQGEDMLDSNSSSVGGMMGNMVGGFFGGFQKKDKNEDS
ncbi:MAG: prephenate dehydrogenase/arogenate dehydrogenase family protein [Aggregatilineales bacterium]